MAYSYAGKDKEKASLTTDIRFTLWSVIFQRGIFQDPNLYQYRRTYCGKKKFSFPSQICCAFTLALTTVKVLCPLMQFPSWGGYTGPCLSFTDCTFRKETRYHRWSTTFQIFHVIKNKLKKKKSQDWNLNPEWNFHLFFITSKCVLFVAKEQFGT